MNKEQAKSLSAELERAVWNVAFYESFGQESEELSYWKGRLEALQLVDDTINFKNIAKG